MIGNDKELISQLDKDVKNGLAKVGWSPYTDKVLLNSFNKWLDKPEQMDLKDSIDDIAIDMNGEYMRSDWVKSEFDNWRFNIFKGKKKWEAMDSAPDVTVEDEPIKVDKAKMIGLIELNFFSEFGGNDRLLKTFHKFDSSYNPKNKTMINKLDKYNAIKEYESSLEDKSLTTIDQCAAELFYTGRVTTVNDKISKKYVFVTSIIKESKTRTSAMVYNIHTGKSLKIKATASSYRQARFEEGDLLEIIKASSKPKRVLVDGQWRQSETDKENWVDQYRFIRKNPKMKEDK